MMFARWGRPGTLPRARGRLIMIVGCGLECPAVLCSVTSWLALHYLDLWLWCSGMIIFVCGDGTSGTEATMQFREEKQFWERKLSP